MGALGVAMGAQSFLLHRRAQRGAHRSELKLPSAARGVSGPLFIFSLNSEVATMFSGAASTTPRLSLSSAPSGAQCWARRPWRGRAPTIEMDSCCRWSLVIAIAFFLSATRVPLCRRACVWGGACRGRIPSIEMPICRPMRSLASQFRMRMLFLHFQKKAASSTPARARLGRRAPPSLARARAGWGPRARRKRPQSRLYFEPQNFEPRGQQSSVTPLVARLIGDRWSPCTRAPTSAARYPRAVPAPELCAAPRTPAMRD